MRAGAAAALLLLCACSPPANDLRCRATFFGGSLLGHLGVAGEEVGFVVSVALDCPKESDITATVSVQDPDNASVPLSGSNKATIHGGTGITGEATFTFLPLQPGPYHVTTRLEPNLGLLQNEVFVAENRRDAGAALAISNPGPELLECDQLELDDAGRVLCLFPRGRMFTSDGTLLDSLPGPMVRNGASYWTIDETSTVSRWLERPDGGGFDLSPTPTFTTGPKRSPTVLAPAGDDLLVSATFKLHRLSVADGGLVAATRNLATEFADATALWSDGEVTVMLAGNTLCTFTAPDAGSCSGFGTGVASEPGGIWVSNGVALSRVDDRGALDLPVPATGWTLGPVVQPWWDSAPTLISGTGQAMVVGARGDRLVLEKYPDFIVQAATSRYVTLRRPDDVLLIFRR